jgi:hypothetical protein
VVKYRDETGLVVVDEGVGSKFSFSLLENEVFKPLGRFFFGSVQNVGKFRIIVAAIAECSSARALVVLAWVG